MGNLVVGLSFPFFPQIPRVSIRGILHCRPTWLAHALTILVFSVSSGWLRLLQQVSCLLCVIFFLVQLFLHSPAFPCFLKPHLPFPVSCSLSLSLSLSLPSSFPVSGRPSFGSARLSCLPHVLSHSLKKKNFPTLLSFFFALLLLSFCSFCSFIRLSSWRNRNS